MTDLSWMHVTVNSECLTLVTLITHGLIDHNIIHAQAYDVMWGNCENVSLVKLYYVFERSLLSVHQVCINLTTITVKNSNIITI